MQHVPASICHAKDYVQILQGRSFLLVICLLQYLLLWRGGRLQDGSSRQ